MPEVQVKQNFKAVLKKYISEVLILFIGISISFLFDEWRDSRNDDETAKKHLIVLKNNLMQDTFALTRMIEGGKKLVQSTHKLAYFKQDSEIADSIDFHIDNAASYLGFTSNQTAYEEIKQTGHTSLIKNDSLKRAFLTYYTSVIPYCNEWSSVDKTYTMTQIIPEMSLYFPVVLDTANRVSTREKAQSLRNLKLRNLLLTSATYKQEEIKAFSITKEGAKKLINRIDDELKK